MRAVYITRSDLSFWGMSHTFVQTPLAVAERYELTLCLPIGCRVPEFLEKRCVAVVYFKSVANLLFHQGLRVTPDSSFHLFTGFDFPCMRVAMKFKRRYGCRWTVFCWDPPALAWRDGAGILRRAIDVFFRYCIRHCDRLVLSIHPGLLQEIGMDNEDAKVVRVTNGCDVARLADIPGPKTKLYDVGVLSAMTRQKGWKLVQEAMKDAGAHCHWIAGRPQDEAWAELKQCKIALLPYLPTHALKWNYPIKLFEYLALGMPIVAADNPGIANIIVDGENGLLFKSGDAQDLRRVLMLALNDNALRERLSEGARKAALKYDWAGIRAKMVQEGTIC